MVEMDMLNMEDNILKEDYAGWSDHSEPEEDEPVQRDSTDEEHSDTSTDEPPSLIDGGEGSEHDENEVQEQMNDVVITLQYVDDMIIYDPMELDDVRAGTTCIICNLTYDGSYDDHAEECCMHGYCTIHRRWEGVRHGRIKCDLDGYNPRYDHNSMSSQPPAPKDVSTDMYQRFRTASGGYTEWKGTAPGEQADRDTTAPDSTCDNNAQAHESDGDRKSPAPVISDDECMRDSNQVQATQSNKKHWSPAFVITNTYWIKLDQGATISTFPDPNAFQVLKSEHMQLDLALKVGTPNPLRVEGVGHVGPLQ